MLTKLRYFWTYWLKEEGYVLFSLSWPVSLTFFLHTLLPLTALIFVGHVSKHKSKLLIDATSLGISFINVTGYAIIFGLSTAIDTLSSQAYGAGNYKRVGVILQRSVLVCSLSLFPIAVVFLNAESILLILHQSPCVARLTGKFCKILVIALPVLYLEVIFVKYLQSQGIVKPAIVTGIISNVVNIISLTLLLFVAGLEIEGAAIATALGSFSLFISIVIYMFFRKPTNKTWQGLNWNCLKEWKPYLWLAIPGVFMVCGEWWTFEIGGFVTGSVDGVQLAAYTITLNLASSGFVIPYGIGTAAGIRVGNLLGAGEPGKAKKSAAVAVLFAILFGIMEMVLLFSFRNIGELFTSDRDVIETIGKVTYLLAVFVFTDNTQAVLGGVLRGCGKQLLVAVSNIGSFYLLGLPVSLTLVYAADMGALGFWVGCAVGSVAQLILVSILTLRIDFKLESHKAQINAEAEHIKTPITTESDSLQHDDMEDEGVNTSNTELNDDDEDIEMRALVTEEENNTSDEEEDETTSPIKLLLIRTPWYIIGLVILITGVVLSQYTIHVPYQAQCDDVHSNNLTNNTNLTMDYLSYQL
ncbi:multidrug and toxin extrusion protein 1-like [Dysidea avara]|uniref:multidrug and toxin extrusion protein 1-like n=1 Tax=Dysidea avara TaxID=196820 RepID=UPI00331D58A4